MCDAFDIWLLKGWHTTDSRQGVFEREESERTSVNVNKTAWTRMNHTPGWARLTAPVGTWRLILVSSPLVWYRLNEGCLWRMPVTKPKAVKVVLVLSVRRKKLKVRTTGLGLWNNLFRRSEWNEVRHRIGRQSQRTCSLKLRILMKHDPFPWAGFSSDKEPW